MPNIRVLTNKPVAFDSPDHIEPWGTARDNSINLAFNKKLTWWIPADRLRVLDLGCSGGGFVKTVLDAGGFALGVEGSDYSKIRRRAEWATIPDNLFTADITEPFQIVEVKEGGQKHTVQFNVITAWEVMEHIHRDRLAAVLDNMSRHLAHQGLIIMSISPNEEIIEGVRLHQTVEGKEWWITKFSQLGFVHHENVLNYFRGDWIRGEDNAPGSFHVALTRKGESVPLEKKLYLLMLLFYAWGELRNVCVGLLKLLKFTSAKRLKRRKEG